MVTITRHVFFNIFQTDHFLDVKFTTRYEKNMRFLVIPNFPKVLENKKLIFAGQENPLIIFRSKEIYIYFKTKNKIPINLLK